MERLKSVLDTLEIRYTERQIELFEKYMEEILEWNTKVNLTTITERDEFIEKHYIDSVLCAGSEEFLRSKKIIDVGTGGGFPGVPLAILFPNKEFLLLDSLNKKLKIIDEICENLGIMNVTTIHGRAEELGRKKELRDKFDICLSRAVANLSTLTELCMPFVKTDGTFIAYKGPNAKEEIDAAKSAINKLYGKLERIEIPEAQEDRQHTLLFISKVKRTAKAYPRRPGEPTRSPLK